MNTLASMSYGDRLLKRLATEKPLMLIGIFDMMSAAIAGQHPQNESLFLSGLGHTLSRLGWPDQGLIDAPALLEWLNQLRINFPDKHLIVDIDGGLGNKNMLTRLVRSLDHLGASAFTLEDQDDDAKRCGHLAGKVVIPLDAYLRKLDIALDAARNVLVIARTDSTDFDDALMRVRSFVSAGAPIVLVDGLDEPAKIAHIKEAAGSAYVMVNLIAGGRMRSVSVDELRAYGATIVNYSTPLSDPALAAMHRALEDLYSSNGRLPEKPQFGLSRYTDLVGSMWTNFVNGNQR